MLAVEEYKFLQKLKSEISNESEEIGGIDTVNNFFTQFEAYHTNRINLKAALSPCKVIENHIGYLCMFVSKFFIKIKFQYLGCFRK